MAETVLLQKLPRAERRAARLAVGDVLRRLRGGGVSVLSVVVMLILWQIASTWFVNSHLIPSPTDVAETAFPMFAGGKIYGDIGISMSRVAVGFISGAVLAVLIGVPMGRIKIVNEMLDPLVEVMRYLSPTAMIPIAVIWFGIGEMSKYFLIFWGTFFFVLIDTVAGVMRTPQARQRAAQCLGATRLQIFRLIVIPSAIPSIVTGMRIAMASSFMSLIPAEMLAADRGIGFQLQAAGLLVETNRIFVMLAIICILGFLADRLLRVLVSHLLARYMTRPGAV